jgi:hypothetical protein
MRRAFGLAFFLIISGTILIAQVIPDLNRTDHAPEPSLIAAEASNGTALSAFITRPTVGVEPAVGSPEPAVLPLNPQPLIAIARQPVPISPSGKQVLLWRGLIIGEHSAAAFDAWSTRDSLASGNGYERNPLIKPFADSSAIYPVLQIAPFGFDYLGHRLMRSNNVVLRRIWWLPQAVSMSASLWCGARNIHVANLAR